MDTQMSDELEEQPVSETPEDVAILYSWANLHGAKYRDFSASRREYRAQVRHRAAEELRQAELKAQAEAEEAAAAAEKAAREAEQAAQVADASGIHESREQSLKLAEDAARIAAAERVEAARRAEAAAMAEAIARREEREIAEAHASAQRQATRYEESESRRRELAGPQPYSIVPGQISDPYVVQQGSTVDHLYSPNNALDYTQASRRSSLFGDSGIREALARSGERPAFRMPGDDPAIRDRRRPQGFRPDEASGIRPAYRSGSSGSRPAYRQEPQRAASVPYSRDMSSEYRMAELRAVEQRVAELRRQEQDRVARATQPAPRVEQDPDGPAWLYATQPAAPKPVQPAPASSVADTLQYSRERVAARWFALKGVFEPGQEPPVEPQPVRQKETRTPVLAVFSLAGGVGKTSLVATLGRSLSSMGEKVLLADTTSHGLLPFYFGASELRPGVVRTFSPPSGSADAPISLVSYDVDQKGRSEEVEDVLAEELSRNSRGNHRLLLDLNPSTGWVARRIARMNPIVLVPVAPDMNSVISLQAVERFFNGTSDHEGRPLQPFYVLNQFDASLPLHLDVREVLRRQLGDRLLPFVIRRSPAVSEALAEGMTVVDYAPEAPVAEDYLNIAAWLRTVSAPATAGFRNVRWSER
ncbi:cellulose synthase operon protein YhjQ [Granulicella rosea]|uniref:Cellulose synthase operon protein YhjQ n=1 Tax=Granulicella rosea TaxID=474952 RepID=A0A239EYL3_9BACT|nr:cellulose synthase operon protein YhjQ/BcsQ [Granulicella rosea]SNS48934.1 cellulose synthase operon protein YhjQ [Granulicella rosea]